MTQVAVLITCFNRVKTTLACLEHIYAAEMPIGCTFEIFLVDDGSTDGTGDAVRARYKDVHVIPGNGHLYWSGGMRIAWEHAARVGFDHYLWLNDDTMLLKNAWDIILQSAIDTDSKAIICSSVASIETGEITYGGKIHGSEQNLVPSGKLTECDIINGNCVLVPAIVFQGIGNIDHRFTHAIGDLDYGLRAGKNNIKCFIAPEIVGYCEPHASLPNWCKKDVPFRDRIRSLYSPLGYAQPKPYFIYVARHFGVFSAIRQLISIHVRVTFPGLWRSQ